MTGLKRYTAVCWACRTCSPKWVTKTPTSLALGAKTYTDESELNIKLIKNWHACMTKAKKKTKQFAKVL